jgi:hypothetical protein
MYHLFQTSAESVFDVGDATRLKVLDAIAVQAKELWSKTQAICFAIQTCHSVEIEKAYVGFWDSNNYDERTELDSLFEVDFINILANENPDDEKLKEARIKKLRDRMADYLSKIEERYWLLVVIKYKGKEAENVNDYRQFNDHYNLMISSHVDFSFGTVCYDWDNGMIVYQSYENGDHDTGFYSTPEGSRGPYMDEENNLARTQADQSAIKNIVKSFNG